LEFVGIVRIARCSHHCVPLRKQFARERQSYSAICSGDENFLRHKKSPPTQQPRFSFLRQI
jgi:hypothetical protein